ncbi:MAG: hypothetical protein P4L67_00930 [Candidatus Pacebacteria bacterium]|nr:hypothetical protein [Candidatus Paceibacterota bacterium]
MITANVVLFVCGLALALGWGFNGILTHKGRIVEASEEPNPFMEYAMATVLGCLVAWVAALLSGSATLIGYFHLKPSILIFGYLPVYIFLHMRIRILRKSERRQTPLGIR